MSEAAKAARAALKAKAQRLVRTDPKGVVDASGYTPPDALDADVKTGARPVSPRLYKRGGKVKGVDAMHHAGRKPRKSGGRALTADSLINRDVREANEERGGLKHKGAFKKGGKVRRQHHADGNPVMPDDRSVTGADTVTPNPVPLPPRRPPNLPAGRGREVEPSDLGWSREQMERAERGYKKGGRTHKMDGGAFVDPRAAAQMQMQSAANRAGVAPARMAFQRVGTGALSPLRASGMGLPSAAKKGGRMEHPDEAADRALVKKMVKGAALTGKKDGGETGGKWIQGAIKHPGALHKSLHVPAGEKIPAKKLAKAAHSDNPKLAKRAHLAETLKKLHRKDGGSAVASGELEGTRPKGGRIARAAGGKAGKGKMNVNIIIAGKHPDGNMGPPGTPPGGGMPPRPMGQPVAVPPPAGMAPQGAALMPMPVPMPMPQQGGAPIGRRDGGRAYPIHDGAGGGEGRLQKIKAYGLKPRRG
jgi:hypothetical protein